MDVCGLPIIELLYQELKANDLGVFPFFLLVLAILYLSIFEYVLYKREQDGGLLQSVGFL